jgi:hypothetical protein
MMAQVRWVGSCLGSFQISSFHHAHSKNHDNSAETRKIPVLIVLPDSTTSISDSIRVILRNLFFSVAKCAFENGFGVKLL